MQYLTGKVFASHPFLLFGRNYMTVAAESLTYVGGCCRDGILDTLPTCPPFCLSQDYGGYLSTYILPAKGENQGQLFTCGSALSPITDFKLYGNGLDTTRPPHGPMPPVPPHFPCLPCFMHPRWVGGDLG